MHVYNNILGMSVKGTGSGMIRACVQDRMYLTIREHLTIRV